VRLKIGVIGAGSFGTALAHVAAYGGHEVVLYGRDEQTVQAINERRQNPRYLQGVTLHSGILATTVSSDLTGADLWLLAVPSQFMRETCHQFAPMCSADTRVAHVAKGLEVATLKRLSEVIAEELPDLPPDRLAILSGPSHAEELSRGLPTTIAVASVAKSCAEFVQDALMNERLRIYTTPDVIGAEIGGALKNVIALGCGISDGLQYGDNARAALMTRGLVEISRLGVRMGAALSTFSGLTGMGDLVVTCNSRHSRNWNAGYYIGSGLAVQAALSKVGMAVEGVRTAQAAKALAATYGVDMPIAVAISEILFTDKSPLVAVEELMTRSRTHESEELLLESTVSWLYD